MRYLVVIPVYNEERNISDVVNGVFKKTRDVLVVDDGSDDGTLNVLKSTGVAYLSQRHAGKGAALRAGFRYALDKGYEWVITMDGDGQHDSGDIQKIEAAMKTNGTDIIIGSRMEDTSRMPLLRIATNRFMSYLISSAAGCRLPDTQCGFRAIRCKVLETIMLRTTHYDTESELIIKAGRAGFRMTSIPVITIYNGSKSSINKFTDTLRFIRLMSRVAREH